MTALQNELRRKGHLVIGDQLMVYAGEWKLLKPGDQYLAHTEGKEPDVLTCRKVEVQKRRAGRPESGKVYPKERGPRLYDLHEVVKVTFMPNPNLNKEQTPDVIISESGERADVRVPEPGGVERVRPEPSEHSVPRQDGPQSGSPRPVPRPPGRGGKDYSAVSTKRAAEASKRAEAGERDAGEREQRRDQSGGRSQRPDLGNSSS